MRCQYIRTIFKNTWFDHTKLDLETSLKFINLYLREYFSNSRVEDKFNLSDKTICDWASFCREVLVDWCLPWSACLLVFAVECLLIGVCRDTTGPNSIILERATSFRET